MPENKEPIEIHGSYNYTHQFNGFRVIGLGKINGIFDDSLTDEVQIIESGSSSKHTAEMIPGHHVHGLLRSISSKGVLENTEPSLQ